MFAQRLIIEILHKAYHVLILAYRSRDLHMRGLKTMNLLLGRFIATIRKLQSDPQRWNTLIVAL